MMKTSKINKQKCLNIVGCCGPVAISVIATLGITTVRAETYFNPAFLSNDANAVADLVNFTANGGQSPGTYRVDIYLNDNFVSTRDVVFNIKSSSVHKAEASKEPLKKVNNSKFSDIDNGLEPCLTIKDLNSFGVNINAFMSAIDNDSKKCIDISTDIPDSSAKLDFEKLRLDISMPQAALLNSARGYISPEYWDDGINAYLLNYNLSGSQSKNGGNKSSNEFVSLQNGLNFGPWRLRDNTTWSYSKSAEEVSNQWQHISTYLQRAIIPLKGNLTVGDTNTSSDVFDSIPIRGVLIASDDNMLPDSLKGFAPTVRGIAKSNAKVTIKQNGYTIYQTYVSPGAFAIDDLFPTSSSGDLNITVEESNGDIKTYTVPYSAVPILQREGRVKYFISAAEYHSGNENRNKPEFLQGTLIWGLPQGYTIYGGSQLSDNYHSFALGFGKNLGTLGAVSIDLSNANSILTDGSEHHGNSLRFLYAKALNEYGTNFQLLGYRYSTEGYYTFDETTYKIMNGYNSASKQYDSQGDLLAPSYSDYYNLFYSKRGKAQVSISQQVPGGGSIFITGSQQTYWHTDEVNSLAQVGYNGSVKDVQFSIAYSYNKAPGQPDADQMLSVSLSLPISKWLSTNSAGDVTQTPNNAYATYSNNVDRYGNMNHQMGISGTALKNNNLSYSVMEGYGDNGVGNSGSTSVSYQGTYGNVNAGYNYSGGYQQVNYGAAGGLVLHSEGLTLSQPLGDTNVLVSAPGASGVSVENNSGVGTDWRGYAIVPYASTYRSNRIALDTTTLNEHTDIDDAVANVIPTQGALVRAKFNTHLGVRALLSIIRSGKSLPFGATVSHSDSSSTGIVNDDGQVYLSGLPLTGELIAKWGNSSEQQCKARYSLPENGLAESIVYAKINCR